MDVMSITACGCDETVVYLHEVMLRTMSTFCKSRIDTHAAGTAFPMGVCRFEL